MAARDRFGGFSEPATTPLQRYIQNACDPQNFEPNLALDLEISDLINAKKGTAPREAAIAIVTHINNRNPNISMLALTLLDICVKNCGYPFHLQISTKEFLNELVRRFPERPPIRYSRTQAKILELIEEWRSTICRTSKYKEDLGFIRDMHRLLHQKGYTFPETKREDAAVLNPTDNLQSAEEMEAEEREAQSAKLQELIRRGTPHDLQEANKLMKVMAGYDTRRKTDYRAKAAEEVSRVQQKAKILEEMLQEHKAGDDGVENDGFEELANALVSASPKIQKMCEEESDDHEAVAKLLEINDSIHRTLERYRLVKKGDLEGAAKIPKGTLGMSGAGVSRGANNELNLIDFGGEEAPSLGNGASSSAANASSGLENDLLGLSMGDSSGAGGEISLGGGGIQGLVAQAYGSSSQALPQPKSHQPQPQPLHSSRPSASNDLLGGGFAPPPQQKAAAADPFAALSSSSSSTRNNTPFQAARSSTAPRPSNGTAPPAPAADDEWTFSSALPAEQEVLVVNSSIHVKFLVSRAPNANELLLKSAVSNNTPQLVSDLTFQLAVTKVSCAPVSFLPPPLPFLLHPLSRHLGRLDFMTEERPTILQFLCNLTRLTLTPVQ